MGHEVQDPDYQAKVRESFSQQRVMTMLGAVLAEVRPGRVEIRLPARDDLTQQHGFLHAGIVATIADSACGYAAFSLMPPESGVLSVEFKVNLLTPARGEVFIARGSVVRAGRTITTCKGDVFAREGDQDVLVATLIATMMTVRGREAVKG